MSEEKIKAAVEQAMAEETDASAATGRCRISVYTSQYCYNGMTLNSCLRAASNVGGR